MRSDDIILLMAFGPFFMVLRILYLLWVDQLNPEQARKGIVLAASLIIGLTVYHAAVSKLTPQLSEIEGLNCQKFAKNLWMCGGWPVFWDTFGDFLAKIRSPLLSFIALPAQIAPVIATAFIYRKMGDGSVVEGWDLMKAFGAGFILFFSLTFSALLLSGFTWFVTAMQGNADNLELGRKNMSVWVKSIGQYADVLHGMSFYEYPYILSALLGAFAFVVNVSSTALFIYQLFLVAAVPYKAFSTLLTEKMTIWPVLQQIGSIALIGLCNTPLWLLFSILKPLAAPTVLNGTLVYSDAEYWELCGVLGVATVGFGVYYTGIVVGSLFVMGGSIFGGSK